MTVPNSKSRQRQRAIAFIINVLGNTPQPLTCAEICSHLVDHGLRENTPSIGINVSALLKAMSDDPDCPVKRRETTLAERVRLDSNSVPSSRMYLYWATEGSPPERRLAYLGGDAEVITHPRARPMTPEQRDTYSARERLTQLRNRRYKLEKEIRELELRLDPPA